MQGLIKIHGWTTIENLITLLANLGLAIAVDHEQYRCMGKAGGVAYIATKLEVLPDQVKTKYHITRNGDVERSFGSNRYLGDIDLWVLVCQSSTTEGRS